MISITAYPLQSHITGTYLGEDGETYISLLETCQYYDIDFDKSMAKLLTGHFLSDKVVQLNSEHYALPIKYFYGWLCSQESTNPEFLDFQTEAFKIMAPIGKSFLDELFNN